MAGHVPSACDAVKRTPLFLGRCRSSEFSDAVGQRVDDGLIEVGVGDAVAVPSVME